MLHMYVFSTGKRADAEKYLTHTQPKAEVPPAVMSKVLLKTCKCFEATVQSVCTQKGR